MHGSRSSCLYAGTVHPHDSRWRRPDDSATTRRPASASLVDPEDDVPSATYPGDYETTKIPDYDSGSSSILSGLELLNDPEPLPYVEPSSTGRHRVESSVGDDQADRRAVAAARRGTQDLGLLLLRASVGAILIAHGLQKACGIWGGGGLDEFQN